MKKIKIKTRHKTYPVVIGSSVLNQVTEWIKKYGLFKNLFIVVDENVYNLHKKNITDAFDNTGGKVFFYTLKAGEQSKSIDGLTGIISSLVENNFGRDTLLIAIGGGVTGDIAGFAASVYMRGIQLVQIPTTLLAAVDSSIGGKTGINFNNYKNIIGAFRQPEFVVIDTDFLSSLPETEINSGIGEIIKYGFLTNKNFYDYIYKNFEELYSLDKSILNKVINESVFFKGSVISKDEYEGGLRKILNLGHTFAHAYESHLNYSIKHGEAVCAGIISALFLSYRKGLISEKKLNRFLKLPLKMKLSPVNFSNYESILQFMYGDKKNREGLINFVLIKDIGNIITDVSVKESDITYSIEKTIKVLKQT